MIRRFATYVVLTLVALSPIAPGTLHSEAQASVRCGVERWAVKTLSDRHADEVDYHARRVSIQYLRERPRPEVHRDSPRIHPYEFRSYRVRARLQLGAREDDHDYHLVVSQPHHRNRTLIVEFPDPHCHGAAGSAHRRAMTKARRHLIAACGSIGELEMLSGTASIKGVAFWDIYHGQTGSPPNVIELHPALAFRMVRGSC